MERIDCMFFEYKPNTLLVISNKTAYRLYLHCETIESSWQVGKNFNYETKELETIKTFVVFQDAFNYAVEFFKTGFYNDIGY